MPQIIRPAIVGTLESSDVQIRIEPNPGKGVEVRLDSIVKMQFGDAILETVNGVLKDFGIADARITLTDKGAVDAVIKARMQVAVCRAADIRYDWSRENHGEGKKRAPAGGLRRTSLYASGASPVNILQAQFYNEDCLVCDLEDSVPPAGKDAARFLVYNLVRKHAPADKHLVIRVNQIHSPYFDEDIEAAVRARPDSIRLPKVESADDVRIAADKIEAVERAVGMEVGSVKLWCNLESYLGILRAEEIAEASPRVIALALSAEDFTASMRTERTKPGWEIFHARNLVLMACRKAGVDAQDAVFADINDMDGLRADMEMSKALGFDGKTVVHPRQIDIVNSYFTPSNKEIDYAIRVFDALEDAKRQNKGAVALDGNMIDEPMVRRARTVLSMAKAAGIKVEGDYYDR